MALRDTVFDNLIGDLEYHPKRAIVYFGLSIAALCVCVFAPFPNHFATTALVFGAGGLTLLLKGVFLMRKTSDGFKLSGFGLDLSDYEGPQQSRAPARKTFPSFPFIMAQLVQDFGAGPFLLGPILNFHNNIQESSRLPSFAVFLTGVILFGTGWLIRLILPADGYAYNKRFPTYGSK